MYPSTAVDPGDCSRAYTRTALPTPGSVEIVTDASASGPNCAPFHQAVHVVVNPHATCFDATFSPTSPLLLIPFDQRPASLSGLSSARSKSSKGNSAEGVADTSPD